MDFLLNLDLLPQAAKPLERPAEAMRNEISAQLILVGLGSDKSPYPSDIRGIFLPNMPARNELRQSGSWRIF